MTKSRANGFINKSSYERGKVVVQSKGGVGWWVVGGGRVKIKEGQTTLPIKLKMTGLLISSND